MTTKSWNRVFSEASKQMRTFNEDLIYNYRKDGIDKIPVFLEKMFQQVMEFFNGQMTFVTYRPLSPEERVDYVINNQITKGSWSIRDTATITMRYELSFQGKPYYIYIDVPYMKHGRLVYNDTEYWPFFPIVERSGVNRTENGSIIVKVMRVPITFGRRSSDRFKIISVSGKTYPELLVTVKIHQGKNPGKKSDHIPLVLYPLCKYGYLQTMTKYGFDPSSISLSDKFDTTDKVYEYFIMPDGRRYLKVKRDMLTDAYKLRMVLSLYRIFVEIPEFEESDAFSDFTGYYLTVLGKFTNSKDTSMTKLLLPNAKKHLAMTDPMLDLVAKDQLRQIKCNCNDIYDLLQWMYFNIDGQLVSYDPTNLFDKKNESLDTLACRVARNIAYAQYMILNSKKAILDRKTVEQFCKRASQRPSWIAADENERSCKIFGTNPAIYNDNYLLAIGLKRCLMLESVSSSSSHKNRKSNKSKTPPHLLKAHPSQLIVTSILDIPASSPIQTGSLNPYVRVDGNGNIIKEEYASEIENVFA